MAIEDAASSKELIEATQNAVIQAADNVANIIENTTHDIHGAEAYYEHPTFWVAVSFVLVILLLARPIGKLVKQILEKRVDSIIKRITDAANLKDDAQKLLVEYERKFVNADMEANTILQKAKKEAELLKKESLEKLKNSMNTKEKEAEGRLEAAQSEAVQEISKLASELTIKTVKTAIEQKLNDQNQDELIEQSIRLMANLPGNLKTSNQPK